MVRSRVFATRALALTLLIAPMQLACRSEGTSERAAGAQETDIQPERTYTVRGVVRDFPEGDRKGWLSIQHEALPDFVGLTGELEPMAPMMMTFTLDETLDVGEIARGDKIVFQLRVDWGASEPALVTGIVPLPADTELHLTGEPAADHPSDH